MPRKFQITPEQEALALEMYNAGAAYQDIAEKIGVGKTGLYQYAKAYWPKREEKKSREIPWSDEQLEMLVSGFKSGKPWTEIEKETGHDYWSMCWKLQKLRYEIKFRKYGVTDEEKQIIKAKYNEVEVLDELCAELNISISTLHRVVNELGLVRTKPKRVSPNFHGTSDGAKKMWADPARMEKHLDHITKFWSDDDNRKRHAERAAEQMTDEKLAAMMGGSKEFFSDPANMEDFRQRCREIRCRPDVVEKIRQSSMTSSIERHAQRILTDLGVPEEWNDTGGLCWIPHHQIKWWEFDIAVFNPTGKNLLIECQGDYWHALPKQKTKDKQKYTYFSRYLSDENVLLYIWEHEFEDLSSVEAKIRSALLECGIPLV